MVVEESSMLRRAWFYSCE